MYAAVDVPKVCVFSIIRVPSATYRIITKVIDGLDLRFQSLPTDAVNQIMKVGSRRPFLVPHLEIQTSVHDPKILVHSLEDATTHLPISYPDGL